MRIWGIWSGELSFPCPKCGKEVRKEDLRWLVERVLLDANPEMLREMRAQRTGEEEHYFSWLKELYAGERFFMCPMCGAGVPEYIIRYMIDRVLAGANPELLVRVKASLKAEKGESVLKNLYFGQEHFSCTHCFERIGEEVVRHLIEQILEEANPRLLEELRTQWKTERNRQDERRDVGKGEG